MTGKSVLDVDRRAALKFSVVVPLTLAFARRATAGGATGPAAGEKPANPLAIPDMVKARAKTLAEAAFEKPKVELPEPFNKLSYDQYRDIRFRAEQAVWRGQKLDFEVQLFPMGWLYEMPAEIWLVEDGSLRQLVADSRLFVLGPLVGDRTGAAPFGFSGFRLHAPINRADYFDEFVVFQGASYLRAIGRGLSYGASARGLAINTAQPGGEEFPFFRAFWIERPKPGDKQIVVHALLDSVSATGAYKFTIEPGDATIFDVELVLFPRKTLAHVGIGPLTSMFLAGPANQRRIPDFRPEVHDSEGLAMWNGGGERLWRPLNNPKTLQISAFMDKSPKGFGLWQRGRNFADYQDLEARYEKRPTAWVETKGDWGGGFIELVEIPIDDEIHDNVVAYWRPSKPLEKDIEHNFAYRLHWSEHVPAAWSAARVAKTRIGNAKKTDTLLIVIDFDGDGVKDLRDLPVADVTASAGKLANIVVQRNPEISGIRASFELAVEGAELIELRAILKLQEQILSETWLYRWTKP